MKKTETIKLMGILAAAYPNSKQITEAQVEIWHECLKDLTAQEGAKAIQKHILTSTFPPTIAEIRTHITEIKAPELSAGDAWAEVQSAIKKYGYYNATAAFEEMAPQTAKAAKSIGWEQLCHSQNQGVERGQFLKIYDSMAKRVNEQAKLPPAFREEIKQLAAALSLEGPKDE